MELEQTSGLNLSDTKMTKDQFLAKFEKSLIEVKENRTISINELFDIELVKTTKQKN